MPTAAGRALTAAHLEEDVGKFKYHNSCDSKDLLNNQHTYMSRITKPINMSPTKFKNKIVKINSLIDSIPDAKDHDIFSDQQLKNMVFNAMPNAQRKHFWEVRRRSATEKLDSIAAFFDMYFKEEQCGSPGSQARIMTVMTIVMTAMIAKGMAKTSTKERATVPETTEIDTTMI